MKDIKNVSISFTGDIAFDKYMDKKWEDEELISEEILSFLHDSDHVVVDVEGPVSAYEDNKGAKGLAQMVHAINPKAIKVLDNLHADVWDICNNHMMDLGEKGLLDTLSNAKKAGVSTIGAGKNIHEAKKPLFYEEAGGVGMFAIGYRGVKYGCKSAGNDKAGCLTWDEKEVIKDTIRTIKKKCRWCIIVCHGGEEFTTLPSPYVRDRLKSFLDMGADIIVCHHPHVPLNYELFDNKAIFYSLGNFIFDTPYQRTQHNTNVGVLLKLHLNEENYTFESMGIEIRRDNNRIVKGKLPDIFCDVNDKEYNLLSPLAAKMFISATKTQYTYIFPDKYKDFDEDDWKKDFLDPNRLERIEGEILDYIIIYNLALKAEEGTWKQSSLTKVKEYIIKQI